MKNIYKIIPGTVFGDNGKEHIVYGIVLYTDGNPVPGYTRRDVFAERADCEKFVELCNRLELSPEHIDDVIADVLAV